MHAFDLREEQRFDPHLHVEQVLGTVAGGDVSGAYWETGQVSPYHCHPEATEIYFCFEGGGLMITPKEGRDMVAGSFVVHPPGELHEYTNGPQRSLLFRVRYGVDVGYRTIAWPTNPDWSPTAADLEYLRQQTAAGDAPAAVVDAARRHLPPSEQNGVSA